MPWIPPSQQSRLAVPPLSHLELPQAANGLLLAAAHWQMVSPLTRAVAQETALPSQAAPVADGALGRWLLLDATMGRA